jgi:hypothetical protein
MSLTYFEATQLATQPGRISPFPLYEGDYQFVHLHSGATPALAQRGNVAYFRALPPPMVSGTPPNVVGNMGTLPIAGNWEVTTGDVALNANLVTGIFLNAISPGNFGFIQTGGRASVLTAAAGTIGQAVNATAATGNGTPGATAGPALLGYLLSTATAGGVAQVKLQLISAQQ